MNANEYQKQAARTLIDDPGEFTNRELMLIWCSVGLSGEAGEVAELLKKAIFHRHGLDASAFMKLKKEIGDVCWYIADANNVESRQAD